MSFKNAFKLMLSRFSYVWSILLYFFIVMALIVSIGLTFLLPVQNAFFEAGVFDMLSKAFSDFMNYASFTALGQELLEVWLVVVDVLSTDVSVFVNSALFVVFVIGFVYRFLSGLCRLPLCRVISGFMTDNASYGFAGKFVAHFSQSVIYSLFRVAVTTVYDVLSGLLVYFVLQLLSNVLTLFLPFIFMALLICLVAFRSVLLSAWAPFVVVEHKGVAASFGNSIKYAFRHFGSLFTMFFAAWLLIVAVNFFVGIFTFGVGLIVTVPLSMYFIKLMNMTFFYGRTGKSYYVDGKVFTMERKPPVVDRKN